MNQPLDKILTLTDIDEITDLISSYLKKPIVIENEQFSLLAYSSFYIEQFDKANQQTIFSKRWPISILEKFMDEGIVEQLKTETKPFRVKEIKDIGLNQRVVVSTKHNNKILGFIWIQEINNLLTENELQFLSDVSLHIGKLLYQKVQKKLKKDEEKELFFKKIIHDSYQSENQVKWEAANKNIIIPNSSAIVVLTISQNDEDIFVELTETVRLFANALKNPTHLFCDGLKIIVVMGSNSESPEQLSESTKELTNTVLSQFKNQPIYAGIGRPYNSILKINQSYKEALEVINTAKFIGSSQQIFEYKKLGVFHYLETISRQNDQMNYRNEELLILQRKDQESQTDLVNTLEVYLYNNCRLKQTSDQLFIHINTLKYRIKQITDLTGLDLDDFNLKCQLYIDLQLMKKGQ
ncbi:helix-turn-helix domain-containing protein [Bacillus sp. DTU_2020_1000418_1_SI_GHA_SEK_038]|uniref:PucR family transcriptional regulator n=1 Tax=Bacillus sp. DTU_2020_1000418_1_SI_GHA_SEK_038 TaxID=3077585 RepID=UPI0028EDDF8D|nr:helix-turn-helix domain-containing protein [Bacillus sp. DTU_2020_1000418_1_SI_GHA_SEK_038]WNS76621.1 helix-turn-helix domain-containing protein [Bacillus sp. DTU_2020_1000418_1_SI_GHA_SEK_038]